MTRAEFRTSLHPSPRGRKTLYLLRHWHYAEAWRLLRHNWLGWARPVRNRLRRWWAGRLDPWAMSLPALLRWLRPGDVVLDADGAERLWLEAFVTRAPIGSLPAIAFRADPRRTARHGCHPVETVWLLEQVGYQVWLLTPNGPVARPANWHALQPAGASACWLLAVPADWTAPEVVP